MDLILHCGDCPQYPIFAREQGETYLALLVIWVLSVLASSWQLPVVSPYTNWISYVQYNYWTPFSLHSFVETSSTMLFLQVLQVIHYFIHLKMSLLTKLSSSNEWKKTIRLKIRPSRFYACCIIWDFINFSQYFIVTTFRMCANASPVVKRFLSQTTQKYYMCMSNISLLDRWANNLWIIFVINLPRLDVS